MSLLQAGISVGAGLIALLLAALLRTVGRGVWPRTTVALIIGGTMSIIGTRIGSGIKSVVIAADHWLGTFIGQWTGSIVFGLVGITLAVILGFDIYHQSTENSGVTKRTLGCAAGVPLTAVTVGGFAGSALMWSCTAIASLVGWPLAWALGG